MLFVEQTILDAGGPAVADGCSIQNLIFQTEETEKKWIEEATKRVGDWRSFARSVFMRWAITINALHVARDKYAAATDTALTVDTLRPGPDGPQRVHLAVWDGPKAAANYDVSIPLIAAYAVQDLYGVLEEIVFAFYEIFLRANPKDLMQGSEYKSLRAAHRARDEGPDEAVTFNRLWEERFEKWRRNKTFDGLHRVFVNLWRAAGLTRPSWYTRSDIDDWAHTIETIAEIRHLVVHGEDKVSERLAKLCEAQPALGMKFKDGDKLDVRLVDLWIVDDFINSLLDAINGGLMELGLGKPLTE